MPRFHRREFIGAATSALVLAGKPAQARGQPAVGFIFVAASWCHFCKAAAPLVYDIAAEENIPTLVISTDAKPIPPFTTFSEAVGHPIADAIEAVPALLIYAPLNDGIIARIDGFQGATRYRAKTFATLREAVRLGYVEAA